MNCVDIVEISELTARRNEGIKEKLLWCRRCAWVRVAGAAKQVTCDLPWTVRVGLHVCVLVCVCVCVLVCVCVCLCVRLCPHVRVLAITSLHSCAMFISWFPHVMLVVIRTCHVCVHMYTTHTHLECHHDLVSSSLLVPSSLHTCALFFNPRPDVTTQSHTTLLF